MSCVGFDGTDFAVKTEVKGNFKNSSKPDFLHDVWWVFYIVCLCVYAS